MNELFKEFGENIAVGDFGITYNGALITNVLNSNGKIEFWCGNPQTDKYAEQVLPNKETQDLIIDEIVELL
jgi:hypothetical protein